MKTSSGILGFIRIRTFAQLVCGMAVFMLTHATVSEAADACWIVRHSHGSGFLAGTPAYYLPDFYPNRDSAWAAAIQDMESRYLGMTPWCVSSPLTSFGLAVPCYSCLGDDYATLNAYGLNNIPPITGCYMGEVTLTNASRWGLPPDSGLDISKCANYTIKLSTADGQQESATTITSVEPGKVTKSLVAKVYDKNGQVVPNAKVKLDLSVDADSGGHRQHGSDRPKGTLSSGTMTGETITGSTGTNGFVFTFKAPAPAGDHKITASCTGGKNCKPEGPDAVWVGVKDLIPLPGSDVYVLLPNVNDPKHPDNHYMTYTAMLRVTALAALYHGQFPDDPLLHLNDASLERGGYFDIEYLWNRGEHREHKYGADIDIRANPKVNPGTAIPENNSKGFKRIARNVGGCAELHKEGKPQQHYHVKFDGC